ncbi:hypothetical protein MMC32_004164 [Xylographa parallela]|nr:hypothetical protein [Xylographa parallela]
MSKRQPVSVPLKESETKPVPSKTARIKSALRQISGHDNLTSKRNDSSDRKTPNIHNVETVSHAPTKMQPALQPSRSKDTSSTRPTASSNHRSIRDVFSVKTTPRDPPITKTWERTKIKITPTPSASMEILSARPPDTSDQSTKKVLAVERKPPEPTKAKGTLPLERKVVPAAVTKGPPRAKTPSAHKARRSRAATSRRHLSVLEEANEAGALVVAQGATRLCIGLQPSDEDTWRRFAITAESLSALVIEELDMVLPGAARGG